MVKGWRAGGVGERVSLITSYLNTHTQSTGQMYVIFPKRSCRNQIEKFQELKNEMPHNCSNSSNEKFYPKFQFSCILLLSSKTPYFPCSLNAGLVIFRDRNLNAFPSIAYPALFVLQE